MGVYNENLPVSYITVAKDIGGEVEEISTHDIGAKDVNIRLSDSSSFEQPSDNLNVSAASVSNLKELKSHLSETFRNIRKVNDGQNINITNNTHSISNAVSSIVKLSTNKVDKTTKIAGLPISEGITDYSLRKNLNYSINGTTFDNNGYLSSSSLLKALGITTSSVEFPTESGENSFYVFQCSSEQTYSASGGTLHYFDIIATQPRQAQSYIFDKIKEADPFCVKDCLFFLYFSEDIRNISQGQGYFLRDSRNDQINNEDEFYLIKNFDSLAKDGIIKKDTYYAFKGTDYKPPVNGFEYTQSFLEALPNFFSKNSDDSELENLKSELKGANIYFLDAYPQEGTTSVYELNFKDEPNFLKSSDPITQMPIDLNGSILAIKFQDIHSAVGNNNIKTYFDFIGCYRNPFEEEDWKSFRDYRIRTYNDKKVNLILDNGYEMNPYSYSPNKLYIYYYTKKVIDGTSYRGGSAFLIDTIDLSGEEPTIEIPVAINRIYKIDTRLYYDKTDGTSGYIDLEAETVQAFATYRRDLCRNAQDESVSAEGHDLTQEETNLNYYTVDYHVFYISHDFDINKTYYIDAIEGEYPSDFTSGKIKHRCVFVNKKTLSYSIVDIAEQASRKNLMSDISINSILLYQDGEIIVS